MGSRQPSFVQLKQDEAVFHFTQNKTKTFHRSLSMAMNWTLQLRSHNLVFLYHLISIGKLASIPLVSMDLKSFVFSPEPAGSLICSPFNYIKVPNPPFFRVLLPDLRWCSNVHYLLSQQSPIQSHLFHHSTSFPLFFGWRSFHLFRYFYGHCSQEIRDIIPASLRHIRTTKCLTHSHHLPISLSNP